MSVHILSMSCAGIPGTGKSTLLSRFEQDGMLQRHFNDAGCDDVRVIFVHEPMEQWGDLLERFYTNRDMYAGCFQFNAFVTHVDAVEAAVNAAKADGTNKTVLLLTERSMYDQRLFWTLQVEDQLTTADASHDMVYQKVWARWRQLIPELSHVFYLRNADIADTMARVQERARAEEANGLTLDYQQRLLALHDDWYTEPRARPPGAPTDGIPCTQLDADPDFRSDDGELRALAARVLQAVMLYKIV